MTMRVRGKFLVLSAALLLVITGVLYSTGARAVAGRQLALAKENWSADEYMRLLQELYPNPADAARELYFSALEDADGVSGQQRNMVFIFPNNTMKTQIEADEDGRLERAEEKFLLVREHFPTTVWAEHALSALVRVQYSLGNYEQMEAYALAAIDESNWEATGSAELLARMYLDRGQAQKALDLAKESLRRQPGHLALEMMHIQARAYLALGQWGQAAEIFRELPAKAGAIYQRDVESAGDEKVENTRHWAEISRRNLERIAALQDSDYRTGTVAGKVKLGSAGMPGAWVYLMDQSVSRTYFSTAEMTDMRKAVSGTDGTFRFEGVIPGRYVLGVAVRIPDVQGYTLREQQEFAVTAGATAEENLIFQPNAGVREPLGGETLQGTVEFRWDAVDGAAYYDLSVVPMPGNGVTGSFGSVLRTKIRENSLNLNMEEELQKARFYPSFGHSDGKLNPHSVFGQLYPGGKFAWSVTAYNEDGEKISDSVGYGALVAENDLPYFTVSGEVSAADELVWAGEYDKAIAAYEERLAENPADTHALLILARIYQFGATYGERDLKKAAAFYERLIQAEDTPEARRALARVRVDLQHYYEAYGLYRSLLGTRLEDWETHYQLAKAEFRLGQPLEALQRLDRAVTMEYGQYARTYPVALAFVLGESEKALAFARSVDGGDRYLELLEKYVSKGGKAGVQFRDAARSGEYNEALELTNGDEVAAVLLRYLLNDAFSEELKAELMAMEPGIGRDLLLQMFAYH